MEGDGLKMQRAHSAQVYAHTLKTFSLEMKPKPAKEDANPYRRGFGMGGFDSGNDDLSGMEAARNMVQRSRQAAMEQEMAKDEV